MCSGGPVHAPAGSRHVLGILLLCAVLTTRSTAKDTDTSITRSDTKPTPRVLQDTPIIPLYMTATTSVNGVVLPADGFGVACREEDLKVPGKCNGGLAQLSTVLKQLRATVPGGNRIINLDLGDFRGATPFFSLYSGGTIQELRTKMGYDYIAIGAGEFLAGTREFAATIQSAPFQALACNLDVLAMPDLVGVASSTSTTVGPLKLGIVGVYPRTETRGTNLGQPVILRNFDSSLAAAVVTAKANNDYVVVIGQWYMTKTQLEQVAEDIPGIDIIVANFEDSVSGVYTTRGGHRVALAACPRGDCKGGAAAVLIRVDLAQDGSGVVGVKVDLKEVTDQITDDPVLGDRIAVLRRPFDASVTSVIGTAAVKLEGHEEFCRYQECTYGNFLTSALRYDSPRDHIALFNAGGIRGSVERGPISRHTIDVSLPFSDNRIFLKVSGTELARALRHSIRNTVEGNITGRFLQHDGLRVEFNPAMGELVKVDVQTTRTDAKGDTVYEPLLLSSFYNVITTTYLASGGDAYDFSTAEKLREDPTLIRDIIITVVQNNGTVAAEIEGRQVSSSNSPRNFSCGAGLIRISTFECSICQKGQFQRSEVECAYCDDGFYSNEVGASKCLACPRYSRTFKVGAQALSECQCNAGWYGEDGGDCSKCPLGGECPGGTAHVSVLAGHFRSPSADKPAFRRCIPSSACLPGLENACAPGYTDENCGACAHGYFRLLGLCQSCIGMHAAITYSIIIVVIFVVVMLTISIVGPIRERKARVLKALFGIVTNVLQIVSLLPAFYPGIWPDDLVGLRFVAMGSTMSLDLLGPECHGMAFLQRYLVQAFMPFILVVTMAIIYCSHAYLHYFVGKSRSLAAAVKTLAPMYCRTVIACTVFLYLPMASHLLAWFDCTWEADGSYYLFVHPALPCYKGLWLQLLPLVGCLVLLYVLAVPYLLYRLYNAVRHNLNDESFDHATTAKSQYTQVVMYTSYLVIADVYRPAVANWRLIELGWKLAFVAARCLVVSGSFFRGVFGTLLLSILVVMKVLYRPFKYNWVNIFDTVIHFAAYVTSFAGLVLFIDLYPLTDIATRITEVSFVSGLLGIMFTPILALVYTFLLFWRRRVLAERTEAMNIDVVHDDDSDIEVLDPAEDDDSDSEGLPMRPGGSQNIRQSTSHMKASKAHFRNIARAVMGGMAFDSRRGGDPFKAAPRGSDSSRMSSGAAFSITTRNSPDPKTRARERWTKAAQAVASGRMTIADMNNKEELDVLDEPRPARGTVSADGMPRSKQMWGRVKTANRAGQITAGQMDGPVRGVLSLPTQHELEEQHQQRPSLGRSGFSFAHNGRDLEQDPAVDYGQVDAGDGHQGSSSSPGDVPASNTEPGPVDVVAMQFASLPVHRQVEIMRQVMSVGHAPRADGMGSVRDSSVSPAASKDPPSTRPLTESTPVVVSDQEPGSDDHEVERSVQVTPPQQRLRGTPLGSQRRLITDVGEGNSSDTVAPAPAAVGTTRGEQVPGPPPVLTPKVSVPAASTPGTAPQGPTAGTLPDLRSYLTPERQHQLQHVGAEAGPHATGATSGMLPRRGHSTLGPNRQAVRPHSRGGDDGDGDGDSDDSDPPPLDCI